MTLWLACLPSLGERVLIDPESDFDGDGFDEQDGDCNDRDPSVHPGAATIPANALDEDCDGVDEERLETSQPPIDGDGDGATAEEDCDDADPDRYPWAPEVCGDAVDQDCDGESPACRVIGTVAVDEAWTDGTDLGASLWSVGDLDGDVWPELLAGDGGTSLAVLTWVEGPPPRIDRVATLTASSGFFDTAASAGDLDGDGADDLILGLPTAPGGELLAVPGPLLADATLAPAAPAGSIEVLGTIGMGFGAAVDAADLDDDGQRDLVATQTSDGGAVWLLYAPHPPTVAVPDRADTATIGSTQADDDDVGASLAVGDLTADGVADVAISVRGGVAGSPCVVLVAGSGDRYSASLQIDDFEAMVADGGVGWEAPVPLAGGDADGDGHGDLWVGWSLAGSGLAGVGPGVATLYPGPIGGGDAWFDAALRVLGDQAADNLGERVGAADLDGDAVIELLVAIPGDDELAPDAGRVTVLDGGESGTVDLDVSAPLATLPGVGPGARWGAGLAGLPDFDGDGWHDLAAGGIGGAGVGVVWGGAVD